MKRKGVRTSDGRSSRPDLIPIPYLYVSPSLHPFSIVRLLNSCVGCHHQIPIPSTLPPTLHCEFGQVVYTIKGFVYRAGALTSNLTSEVEVNLVACPGEDNLEETESIVVERFWETQMRYMVALSGKVCCSWVFIFSDGLHPDFSCTHRAFRSVGQFRSISGSIHSRSARSLELAHISKVGPFTLDSFQPAR